VRRLTFLIIATFFAATPAAYAQIKYVAVVETEMDAQSGAAAKLNKAEVRQITTVLRNEARNTLSPNKYKIMTSETVQAQGSATLEECADENCVITLGSKIGADYIVRGIISKFGTKLTLSVEMYETEDGTLVGSARVSSEKAEELLEKAVTACGEMYKKFESTQKAQQQHTVAAPPTPTYQLAAAPMPAYQQPGEGFIDSRDGKKYRTAVIGGNRWMAENLNYRSQAGKSWCYDNNNSNCDKYGRLYDWNTAWLVCPPGWHLPTRNEWVNLAKFAGGTGAYGTSGKAGKKLKSTSGWNGGGSGTDEFGFSALPGGIRDCYGDKFSGIGEDGNWWTATEYGRDRAYYRYIYSKKDYVSEYDAYKEYGYFVRCIQN
jgi:uncharacterized protein (TIGR02145 family)